MFAGLAIEDTMLNDDGNNLSSTPVSLTCYPNSLAIGFLMDVVVIFPGFRGFLVVRVPNRVPKGA